MNVIFFIKADNSGNEIIPLENLAELSLTEDFYISLEFLTLLSLLKEVKTIHPSNKYLNY